MLFLIEGIQWYAEWRERQSDEHTEEPVHAAADLDISIYKFMGGWWSTADATSWSWQAISLFVMAKHVTTIIDRHIQRYVCENRYVHIQSREGRWTDFNCRQQPAEEKVLAMAEGLAPREMDKIRGTYFLPPPF
jgi:hypothetical protein